MGWLAKDLPTHENSGATTAVGTDVRMRASVCLTEGARVPTTIETFCTQSSH